MASHDLAAGGHCEGAPWGPHVSSARGQHGAEVRLWAGRVSSETEPDIRFAIAGPGNQ
jgi:hypothetical protein